VFLQIATRLLFSALWLFSSPPEPGSESAAGQPEGLAKVELGNIEWVEASPTKGFYSPYLLRIPVAGPQQRLPFLLVEPNNSGVLSDDPAADRLAAADLATKAIGADLARRLNAPLLVPAFPRPAKHPLLYTHIFDRDTWLLRRGPLAHLDRQLLAMVDDARERLHARGIDVDTKILLTGFSASGAFVNRFTFLHPKRVKAAASGATNGLLMLPTASLEGTRLSFPLGLADFTQHTGAPFDRDAWLLVPQFIYLGALDDNDAVAFDDGYSSRERRIVYRLLGKAMQPTRWEKCQRLYNEAGATVTFRTFPGVGHWSNGAIHAELADFFRQATSRPEH
jgi:hypothetical protein